MKKALIFTLLLSFFFTNVQAAKNPIDTVIHKIIVENNTAANDAVSTVIASETNLSYKFGALLTILIIIAAFAGFTQSSVSRRQHEMFKETIAGLKTDALYSKKIIDEIKLSSNNSIIQMNTEIDRTIKTAETILDIAKSVAESATTRLNTDIKRVEDDINKVESDMKKFDEKFAKMQEADEIVNKVKEFVETKYKEPQELLDQCRIYSVEESDKIKIVLEAEIKLLQGQIEQLKNSKS